MGSSIKRIVGRLGKARRGVPNRAELRRANVVITGPGRSGTTLTCYLLNKLENTVALSEPISPGKFADRMPDHEAVCDGVEVFYDRMRRMALKKGLVISKHVDGVVPTNTKGFVDGVRRRIAEKGRIPVNKDLSPDFTLAIKAPAMFTALLPTLSKRLPCFAIVRNPLSIMASSRSIQKPAGKKAGSGRSVTLYDPETVQRLENVENPAERRLMTFHLLFDRYRRNLPPENIIRYEDIVATGGKALKVIVPAAKELDEPLESKNLNPLYDREDMLRTGEGLLASEGAYWDFYSREDVEALLEQLR